MDFRHHGAESIASTHVCGQTAVTIHCWRCGRRKERMRASMQCFRCGAFGGDALPSALPGSVPGYWDYIIKPTSQPVRLQSAKVRAEPLQGAAPRSWWRVGLREFDNFSCWLRGGQKNPARAAPTARHTTGPSPGRPKARHGKAECCTLPRPLLSSRKQLKYHDGLAQTSPDWQQRLSIHTFLHTVHESTQLELITHRQSHLLGVSFSFGCPSFPETTSQKAAPPPPTDRPTVFCLR